MPGRLALSGMGVPVSILAEAHELRRPLIIAHRAHTPETIENSLAGVQAAIAAGADLVEVDIRLSLDRVPVLHHDAMLGRVSRGRGLVRVLPAAALRRVPLRGGKGQTIPTLAQVLDILPPNAGLALEIKARGALRQVLRVVRDHNRAGQVWLWLSRKDDVELARQIAPDIPMTLLEMPWSGNVLAYLDRAHRAGARAVSIDWSAVELDIVRQAHDCGLLVFSVNHDPSRLPDAIAAHLDGVITDDPATARRVLHSG